MNRLKRIVTAKVILTSLAVIITTASLIVYLTKPPTTPSFFAPDASSSPSRTAGDERDQLAQLPVNWPQAVPIPPGQITASSGLALSLTLDGSYDESVQLIRTMYLSHGFTERPEYGLYFEDAHYTVAVALEDRDHSAVRTNATLVVTVK